MPPRRRRSAKASFASAMAAARHSRRRPSPRTSKVCPQCGQHHKLGAPGWRKLLLDEGALEEWDEGLGPSDPLEFVDGRSYPERIASAQKNSHAREAVEIGRGTVAAMPVGWGAFLFAFMGGSMGSVVGEKIARLFERATAERLPVVLLQASGGARMQEGILSLMQMAKTVAALERLKDAGLPFISVLLHPTTGGVAASFAFLGDVNLAEPGALVGFAGPRVIEQTIRQTLPEGFQRSEFLLAHGDVVDHSHHEPARPEGRDRHPPPSSARRTADSRRATQAGDHDGRLLLVDVGIGRCREREASPRGSSERSPRVRRPVCVCRLRW